MRKTYYGTSAMKRADIAVISTDLEGTVTVFNQSAERILGYHPDDIIGQSAPIADFEAIRQEADQAQAAPVMQKFIHKNGDLIGMEVILSPIRNVDGLTTGFLFTANQAETPDHLRSHHDLPDKSTFDIILDQEIRRNQREGHAMAVLKIDLDHYKAFLDHHGEEQTDAMLTQVAQAFDERIQRAGDFLAYHAHDEFLLILPNTDRPGTVKVAEQLRIMVQSLAIPHGHSEVADCITASIGIAHLVPTRDTKLDHVMAIADGALAQAKQDGRNCSRLGE